ncbi:MAG: mammalian cell entry protein [Cytophagaceae bacterium SCN 52-12]|nr:MAG: mammalian cell entry protein [Cytophagaceae bacterium SCN 52-12]
MSKEAKVGLLAAISLVVLYFGFHFLKGSDVFSRSNTYYVEYDNVDGLTTSNPVLLNGYPVGRVIQIDLVPQKNNVLRVSLDIRKNVGLPEGTKAILVDGGLLGGKAIRLGMGNSDKMLPDESELISEKELGIMALLQKQATPVLSHADSLMINLAVVSEGFKETGESLNKVLANFDKTGSSLNLILAENRAKIAGLMNNMNKLSESLVETEKGIKPLLTNANTLIDSLNALSLGSTVAKAHQALDEVQKLLSGIKAGDGTAGKLLTDDALYNNLNYTMISLNQLLANFREHPKRYINVSVFGKKDRGPAVWPVDTLLRFKEPADSSGRDEN